MTKRYATYEEERLKNWMGQLEKDPTFEERFLFFRDLLQGMHLENALKATGRTSRFLLGCYLATVGLESKESPLGMIGPALRNVEKGVIRCGEEILTPLQRGAQQLLEGIVQMTTCMGIYGGYTCSQLRRHGIDKASQEEVNQLERLLAIIMVDQFHLFRGVYEAFAEALGKKKATCQQLGALGDAYGLLLLLCASDPKRGALFAEGVDAIQSSLTRSLNLLEERTGDATAAWATLLQKGKIAFEKADAAVVAATIDEGVLLCGGSPEQLRKDLEDLCKTNETIQTLLSLALSTQHSIQTEFSQNA